jgi:hypothetical protein
MLKKRLANKRAVGALKTSGAPIGQWPSLPATAKASSLHGSVRRRDATIARHAAARGRGRVAHAASCSTANLWTEIQVAILRSVEDSLATLQLVEQRTKVV